MIPCTCLVQEGQISSATESALRSKLEGFAYESFGVGLDVNWIEVPKTGGFTASKPSTSSLVLLQAPTAIGQEKRADLLSKLCHNWMAETGQTLNEIVGVISDPATP
ncbi:MAG: hypothetical protein AAFQ12_05255 [Pseudomonadota bacterium]